MGLFERMEVEKMKTKEIVMKQGMEIDYLYAVIKK